MNLQLKTDYWGIPQAREAFKIFIKDIHGLDFTDWETHGFWDEAYTPFSYFKDGKVIASVCIYLLDAVIAGRETKLVQISGVGTHKNWRRQGLSRELTDLGLEWAKGKHTGVFLFADEEAIPYYIHTGFLHLDEIQEFVWIKPVTQKRGLVQLDITDQKDLDKIYSYASNRIPVSNKFSILNTKLLMFHALYTMQNNIYEIPELDCLVFYDRYETVINIYDILGQTIPSFEEIYPYITNASDRRINFNFHTDKLGIRRHQTRVDKGANTFVLGIFPVSEPAFPFTSRA